MQKLRTSEIIGICLLLIPSSLALQQTSGKLMLTVHVGGSDSTRYGLINDENETITVKLRVEGDAAEFLTFPTSIVLVTKKLMYVTVTANIPEDYETERGGNLTGYIYAVQEGGEGNQVKINVQARKTVNVLIPELVGTENVTTTEAVGEISPITGLTIAVTNYWPFIAVTVFGVSVFIFLRNYSFKIVKRGGK